MDHDPERLPQRAPPLASGVIAQRAPLPGGAAPADADLLVTRGCQKLDVGRQTGPVWQDGFRSGQRIVRLLGRLSLQVRLVATALCLVAGGAAIIGAASSAAVS